VSNVASSCYYGCCALRLLVNSARDDWSLYKDTECTIPVWHSSN
jgi:hypothetical protein